jgi:hypothetical protein
MSSKDKQQAEKKIVIEKNITILEAKLGGKEVQLL